MTFRVELTAEAEGDADAILRWLFEQQAGRTGLNWFLALEDAIASLKTLPARCPLAVESLRYPYEVRELQYGRRPHIYRVLFTIQEEVVKIISIRHARRQRLQ
jgi:plasmid stabilization system protein ParE